MKKAILGYENWDIILVFGILVVFIILEGIAGHWSKSKRKSGDWWMELFSFIGLSLLIKPTIFFLVIFLGHYLVPQLHASWQSLSIVVGVLIYLLTDDLLQYWYHRIAHENAFLWKLHRPHHQAEEMGFFVSYRNAALYYLLMPNIWWMGICSFLGIAQCVAIGLVLKQIVVISSHSTIHYDKWLYRFKFLNPLSVLIERVFITPAFHHAHHGQSKLDGISDPNGNFGNMFSIWDQIFGTAVFTRKFPKAYGLQNDPKEHWTATLLYPIVASSNKESEISRSYKKTDTTQMAPLEVSLEKGEKYLWCRCGKSKGQPFCDGSHHGTKFKPLLFEAQRTGVVKLCNCKLTNSQPFCDNSHLTK